MGYVSKKKAAPTIEPLKADVWRRFFDHGKTSIEFALGHFLIDVSPDETAEADPEQSVRFELFTLRPRQREGLKWIEGYFWKLKRRAARIICLKSRRYGVSTFYMLLGLERVLRVPGYQVLMIAQDDTSALRHFQRLRDCFAQVPKEILKERGIEVVKDTDRQLVLRHGGYKTSEFHVAPAKRQALGRGARFNMVIVTEFPHYPKSVKAALAGTLAACRNVVGNIVIFEATANGFEAFYRRYKRAAARKSDFRAQFIAAWEHPENRKPFADGAEEDAFIASIGMVADFAPVDETILFRKLTVDEGWTPHDAAEHLNWRRTEIADTCEGSVEFYHQENPNTADEAFLSTGKPIFRKDVLEAWRTAADAREAAATHMHVTISGDKIQTVKDPHAEVTIFGEPEKGMRYCFGADVASGKSTNQDGSESDFSVCIVKEVKSGITVARFRGHLYESDFARSIFALGCYYNGARGYVERSINSSSVVIGRMSEMTFGEWDGVEMNLKQKLLIATDTANAQRNYQYHPGFMTTGKTKPELVDNIRVFVKDTSIPDGVKQCPWDAQFIEEAFKFERVAGTTRMEAAEGHDDCVMAEGLALEARNRLLEEIHEEEPPPPPKGSLAILLKYAQAEIDQREAEGDGDFHPIDGMPGY